MAKRPKRHRNRERNRRNREAGLYSAKTIYAQKCRKSAQKRLSGYPRKPQDILNLHGCGQQEAMRRVTCFIRDSIAANLKTIRIITGRGLRSKNGVAVLRRATRNRLEELIQSHEVRRYRSESEYKHGSYMVYLKR